MDEHSETQFLTLEQAQEHIRTQYRYDKVRRAEKLLKQSLVALAECYSEDLRGQWRKIEATQALDSAMERRRDELRRTLRRPGQESEE